MVYCTRADIEQFYGRENVQKWAELDGDKNSTNIATRISDAISHASNDIDDGLRGGPYTVPFADTIPLTILDLARRLAGVRLYESRGIQDFEAETGSPVHRLAWHASYVRKMLAEIKSGKRRLDIAQRYSTRPQVVRTEEADSCR